MPVWGCGGRGSAVRRAGRTAGRGGAVLATPSGVSPGGGRGGLFCGEARHCNGTTQHASPGPARLRRLRRVRRSGGAVRRAHCAVRRVRGAGGCSSAGGASWRGADWEREQQDLSGLPAAPAMPLRPPLFARTDWPTTAAAERHCRRPWAALDPSKMHPTYALPAIFSVSGNSPGWLSVVAKRIQSVGEVCNVLICSVELNQNVI
mmetsp:Transcript_5283/g.13344  ORF Transcript_5283/g.13344 Transcript_5283/m.13344 type:complete len:205 (-) Transcript_5283:94-708(-)